MKTETGFTVLETLAIVLTFGILAAICAPSISRANHAYQLQAAGQQIVQEVQRAKISAVGRSTPQSLFFNTANRTVIVNGTTFTLPDGIQFAALPSNLSAPSLIEQAAQNSAALPTQQSDARSAISMPAVATTQELRINTKGLPNVEPGVVNWIYLTNREGQRAVITLTSAGSVAMLTLRDGVWK
ncbi:MAG: hypothetical protein U0Y68_27485 [Blastocatellia bacterium]